MNKNKKETNTEKDEFKKENMTECACDKDELAEDTTQLAEDQEGKDQEEQPIEKQEDTQQSKEESLEEKYTKLSDSYIRLMAEYDNYRKRTLKEKSELIRNGGEKVLKELLPIVDDFELAVKNMPEGEGLSTIREGVKLIHSKFIEYLNRQGVKAIETENKAFDEELHEAIAVVPASDESTKGTIIDCVKTGYTLNEKVLRHSNVVVAK